MIAGCCWQFDNAYVVICLILCTFIFLHLKKREYIALATFDPDCQYNLWRKRLTTHVRMPWAFPSIDASHSRQPLVSGNILVRYEVNAAILWSENIFEAVKVTGPARRTRHPTGHPSRHAASGLGSGVCKLASRQVRLLFRRKPCNTVHAMRT